MTRGRGLRKRTGIVGMVTALAVLGIGAGTATAVAPRAKATPVAIDVGDTAGTKAPMTMTVTPASAPAGKVKFTVTNSGTVIHEMVVIKTKVPYDQMPVSAKHRISEAKAVGEIGDIPKGKTKSKVMKLKPGKYVLACNLAKHYELGMRAPFTVTK